ncbi:MAG: formate/nitrite transporter family protein [Angelakisella sp.]
MNEGKKLLLTGAGGGMAGLMVGMAGMVFLATDNQLAGAVLFCIALLSICSYGMRLFTGSIGYLLTDRETPWTKRLYTAGAIWLGNLAGTTVSGWVVFFMRPALRDKAQALCAQKLTLPLWTAFVLAVFCGLLMYLAVDIYRTRTGVYQLAGIFLAVPVFIMAGFEHSIADMFYLAASHGVAIYSLPALFFLLVVTLGNAAGSLLLPLAKEIAAAENR